MLDPRGTAPVLGVLVLCLVLIAPTPSANAQTQDTHLVKASKLSARTKDSQQRGWWPWDLPGRMKDAAFGGIRDAINGWFKSIVESALTPVFDLFSRTVFSTPDLSSQARLVSLWRVALGIADAALVLFAVGGGAIVMTTGDVSAALPAKEMLPRLLTSAGAANLSLVAVSTVARVSNSVVAAVIGSGGNPRSVSQQMTKLISGAFANPFLSLFGLVVIVLGLLVVAVFVLRIAALVVLVGGAPLMLICHALPQTEHLARLWWRAMFAALWVPLGQALVLATALRVVLSGDLLGLSSNGLVDLLVVACLLYLMAKIPLLAANAVKSGSGSRGWEKAKSAGALAAKVVVAA
ncbi:MAG: hypothetical protein M3P18_02995 [Actinomycetota bacterium]|nr:hypothetical protein [Actinomycetota bacterium]